MPLTQLTRAVTSFVVVVLAYGLYSVCIVPLIEPHIGRAPGSSQQVADRPYHPPTEPYRELLAPLFPAGSWELKDAKVLKTPNAILLLRDYQPMDHSRLKIDGCTVVYMPQHGGGSRGLRQELPDSRSPIVMRAREAILKFDGDLNLQLGKVGRIVGGWLVGPITITRAASRPGAGDDFWASAKTVQIFPDRIWTPHDVQLRLGRSTVSGRDLTILLQRSTGHTGTDSLLGSLASEISSIKLAEVDRIHLMLDAAANETGQNEPRDRTAPGPGPSDLEITCNGPLQVDLINKVAAVKDRVDVIQLYPDGTSVKLSCDQLGAYFAAEPEASGDPSRGAQAPHSARDGSSSWQVERIVARGAPVVLHSPGRFGNARCDLIEYDLPAQRLRMQDHDKVWLQHGHQQMESPRLRYEFVPNNRIGRLWAAGPGRFWGSLSDDTSRSVEVYWDKELSLRPDGNEYVLSVSGKTSPSASLGGGTSSQSGSWVQSAEFGRIGANEIHLWLEPDPGRAAESAAPAGQAAPPNSSVGLRPTRMLAQGRVRLDSDRLRGTTQRLGIWIQWQEPADHRSVARGRPGRQLVPARPAAEPLRPGSAASLTPMTTSPPRTPPPTVRGDWIRVRMLQQPQGMAINDVSVRGHAQLSRGRDMQLAGEDIEMDRAANRVWVDGPGQAALPMTRTLSGLPLTRPESVTIEWHKKMDFNGRTVQCRGAATARTQNQTVQADTLKVTLGTDVDFNNLEQPLPDIQPRLVEGWGDVQVESRTYCDTGLDAIERMYVHEFSVDLVTGQCLARGPGWVSHVKRGAVALRPAGSNPRPASENDQLKYLGVVFQGGIDGNLNLREIHLNRDVRAIYGPVASWDEQLDINPSTLLDEGTVLMNCDRLAVAQIGSGPVNKTPFELRAVGNTVVELRDYVAYAREVKYSQRKDQLILQGGGRSLAELIGRGDNKVHIAGREFKYSPSRRTWSVNGGVSLDSISRGQSPRR